MALLAIKKHLGRELQNKRSSMRHMDKRHKIPRRMKDECTKLQEMIDCLERVGDKLDNCSSNCNLHDVVFSEERAEVCPEWIHKERRMQNEDNFCPICGTDIRQT